MGPGALGGAEDSTQVVGVGDFVAHHQQRRLPLFFGGIQQGLHGHIFPHSRQGDDPLVGVGTAHAIQLAPVGLHHHDALFPGPGGNMAQGLVCLALGQVDFVDVLPGAQSLDHGVAALNDAVRLRLGQGPLSIVFSHSSSSQNKNKKALLQAAVVTL